MLTKWLEQLLGWLHGLRGHRQKVEGDKALQVGRVGGNVYVIHGGAQPGAGKPGEPPRQAPDLGQLLQVYKRELTRAERAGTDNFMRREFGTTTIRDLSDGDQVRLWAYMKKCLRNRAGKQRRDGAA